MNDDDDNRFSSATSPPVDNTAAEHNLSEDELKIQDSTLASYGCNRVAVNLTSYEVLQEKNT